MIVLRAALVAVAAAACAWFALGTVQARDTNRATTILSAGHGRLRPARAAQVRSLLDSAGTLNPDTTVTLLQARLAQRQDRPARAVALAEHAVAAEPQNLDAWLALAQLADEVHNRPVLDRAVAALARLDPRLGREQS